MGRVTLLSHHSSVTLVEGTEARSLLRGVCVERGYPSDYRYLLLLLTCTIMFVFSLCV